ncbi:glycerol-3-phosphate dehydrogenase/oxidase [Chloroflexi bacterium TSY]|nr:glycerol-3-phosphate dehydrogenase/oxidase [Chloroflexi bacterium TSY]
MINDTPRAKLLNRLRHISDVSVLIIGGGVNGIGTFRDLALQDINVVLIDQNDFCSGTSAASSHMAHGGIRYLENGEFRLVREAVEERNRLIVNAPHYVKPLATTIPIFRWFSGLFNAPLKFLGLLDRPVERGAVVIKAGLTMYDAYTGEQGTVPKHRFESRQKSLARFPKLNPAIAFTATYYDALLQMPERLCVEMIVDAMTASEKALAINYMSLTTVGKANGRTIIRLNDEVSGETFDLRPQVVINATGPWIDGTNHMLGQKTHFISGTKGSHLVLDHPELRSIIGEHEIFFENHDGRIVLICPFHKRVIVGTSDIRIDDAGQARCTEEEIDYFLKMVAVVFPTVNVNRSHIVFTYSGVRPLPTSTAALTGQISRDHQIRVIEPGNNQIDISAGQLDIPIYNLIGGKWTTFRAFSEQVTNRVLEQFNQDRKQKTENLAIGGGASYPQTVSEQTNWINALSEATGLDVNRIKRLFERYGTRAEQIAHFIVKDDHASTKTSDQYVYIVDRPLQNNSSYSSRELLFLVLFEQVVHLDDLVLRRSLIAILGDLSAELLKEIAHVIGLVLQWSPDETEMEIKRTANIMADKHLVHMQIDSSMNSVQIGD